jgi:hypothetical protein
MQWKRLLAITAVILLYSIFAFAGNRLPQDWELWAWQAGAKADVEMDTAIKYGGNSSVCVANATGPMSLVLPEVKIDGKQGYQFQGWVRTALKGGQQAHLVLLFYDGEGQFLKEKKSQVLTEDTNWTLLTVNSNANEMPQARKIALACRIWGRSSVRGGKVWFDELSLTTLAGQKIAFANSSFEDWVFAKEYQKLRFNPEVLNYTMTIATELKYTPEQRWQNTDNSLMTLSMSIGQQPRAWVQMYGVDNAYSNYYDQNRNLSVNFRIRTFSISGKTKFRQVPLDYRLGRLTLDYSPYILTLVDDAKGGYLVRHGSSVEGISVLGGFVDSFIFTEDSPKFGWGFRYRALLAKTGIEGILLRREGLADSGSEQDSALAIKKGILGGQFVAELAEQKLFSPLAEAERVKSILMKSVTYQNAVNNLNYQLHYYNFPLAFDPPYRSKLPRFAEDNKTFLGWNPVDRYKGKEGYGLRLQLNEGQLNGKAELDLYTEASVRKNRVFGQLSGQLLGVKVTGEALTHGQIATNSYGTTITLRDYSRLGVKFNKASKLLPLKYELGLQQERYRGTTNYLQNCATEYRIADGKFKGMGLSLGLEQDSSNDLGWRWYLKGNWQLPNRLNIMWRYYNRDHQDSPRYDDLRERYLDYDNMLLLSIITSFS